MRTLILAPIRPAAELYAREHGIRDWREVDGPAALYGYSAETVEVLVLDGGGSRYDTAAILDFARRRGINIRHDRSASPALGN